MANLTDADKVLRNDVGKSIVSKLDDIADAIVQHGGGAESLGQLSDVNIDTTTLAEGQSIVYNPTTQKFENGQVSTVGGLNDLNDVTLENVTNKQELVYDDTDDVFKNKTTRVELTQAEYDQLVTDDEVLPDVDYYITDAPSMQGTSADLSYDGDTDSVYDVVEEVKGDVADLDTSKVNISDLTPKQFATSSLINIQANETVTQTFTVTNAKYGIITGFAITSNLNVVALQFFFNTPTTVQVRVKNVSATADVFGITFFYI